MKPRYLVDTSALLRVKRSPEVARVIGPLLIQGSVAICAPALLEVMYSTRATEHDTTLVTFQQSMHVLA